MEKSSQHPKTQGCSAEGEPVDSAFFRVKRPSRSVPREKREPQAGPASGQSNPASKSSTASGDGVLLSESNTRSPVPGQGEGGLPGSQSVARAEGSTRNEGGPENACRTNCEYQAGRAAQRQEVPPGKPGVGLAHSVGLIRKWVRARILEEDGKVIHPQTGTPQGGIISPVLANIYLHHALDRWFEQEVQVQCQGRCALGATAGHTMGGLTFWGSSFTGNRTWG